MHDEDDPIIQFCRVELEAFQQRLRELEAGTLRFGTTSDGRTWRETTEEDIAFAKAKIEELSDLLALQQKMV